MMMHGLANVELDNLGATRRHYFQKVNVKMYGDNNVFC